MVKHELVKGNVTPSHSLVCFPQPLDVLGVHDVEEVLPGVDFGEIAELPPLGVSREAVVSAPLDADGRQVHAVVAVVGLEQSVADLRREIKIG